MAKCKRSPTGSSAVPLCSLRNMPALSSSSPLPISNLFSLSRQFLDSIPCCSFLHTCALSCFGSPSSFVVVSGRNEDCVVILGDDVIQTTRSTILKIISSFRYCFHIAMLLMSVLFICSKSNHFLNQLWYISLQMSSLFVQLYGWLVHTVVS